MTVRSNMIENPKDVVEEQANDESLWLKPLENPRIEEAMLQEALRRLHAAVEGEEFVGFKGKYSE